MISKMKGYVSHQLQNCIETPNRYVLLINCETLKDHTAGFRGSKEYQEWKALLHHFYDLFPTIEDFKPVTYNKLIREEYLTLWLK